MKLNSILFNCCFCLAIGASAVYGALAREREYLSTPVAIVLSSSQLGSLHIEIGGDGAFVAKNLTRNYVIQARPPKWDVEVLRPADKIYAVLPINEWCSATNVLPLMICPSWEFSFKQDPPKYLRISGLLAARHTMKFEKPVKETRDQEINRKSGSSPLGGQSWRKEVVAVLVLESEPRESIRILGKILGLPMAPGVPVQFEITRSDGAKEIMLRTGSIKPTVSGQLQWQKTTGYKFVSSRELIVSGKERIDLENLLEDMGVGRKLGKPFTEGGGVRNAR